MVKQQDFTELLNDAQDLLHDLPEPERKLVYWVATLDDEARAALVMAYRLVYDSRFIEDSKN